MNYSNFLGVDITESIKESQAIEEILEEARFFQLNDLVHKLEQKRKEIAENPKTWLEYILFGVISTII